MVRWLQVQEEEHESEESCGTRYKVIHAAGEAVGTPTVGDFLEEGACEPG